MNKRALMVLLVVAGCQSNKPKAISSRAFNAPAASSPTSLPREEHPLATVQRPSPIYNQLTIPAPKMPGAASQPLASSGPPLTNNDATAAGISPTVQDVIQPPDIAVTKGLPATKPGESLGTYLTLGGVVAEVNGVPIYADKVVRTLAPVLAARAKELNQQQFEEAAFRLMLSQIRAYEQAELEFAAADRVLDENDKKIARNLTVAWRAKLITDSGGSVELARQKIEADGRKFDEVVHEQYRVFVSQLYYEKKVLPRITISATDMRRYYDANVKTEFSEYDQAQFRLIKVDPAELGDNSAAITRAQEIHDRAAKGEDFAHLAETYNKAGSLLQRTKGDVGMIQRGAYALENVEKAVFDVQPGQITPVVKEKDGCYYIAKLETRKNAVVHPFEDEEVQSHIFRQLRGRQLLNMREQNIQKLSKDAVIRDMNTTGDVHMIDPAMDMAMQRYAVWAEKT
jgi:tetratricopeptide (TPR) repeat protein